MGASAHDSGMAERRHLWRIDGIEEGVARVEMDGERMLALPATLLPGGAREGQTLRVTREAEGRTRVILTIAIDEEGTAAERARSKARTAAALARSRERDPGGNVSL